MKEGPNFSRRASHEKVRDETDEPLGHFVRKLHLKAQTEHLAKRSKDA